MQITHGLDAMDKLLDHDRLLRHLLDEDISPDVFPGESIDWTVIGQQRLKSAGTSITVAGLPKMRYLRVRYMLIPSGAINGSFRLNGDSATNYSYRYSQNIGAVTAVVSQTSGVVTLDNSATTRYGIIEIVNIAAQEKLCRAIEISQGASGGGNAPSINFMFNKWANTSDPVTKNVITTSTNNYAAESEMVIEGGYGW